MSKIVLLCDAVGPEHVLVRDFRERLMANSRGFDVWVHDSDTPSGPEHAKELRRIVGESDAIIAIIPERDRLDAVKGKSSGWLRSPQSFLRIDLEEALKLKKPIVTILLGRAPLPANNDLPRALRLLTSHPTVNLVQAGFDAAADRIVGLVRQAFEAGTAAAFSSDSALDIPAQGYGPHFEIDQEGVIKFAPPGALDQQGNNVDRLRRMHPTLRELSQNLVEALGRGNLPHNYLHERSKSYSRMVDRALEAVDFAMLYIEGVRLANAERAVTADRELPPLDPPVRENIDSLLQLHGSFILASRDGLEAYEAEQRYQRNQQQEGNYRKAAVDFASSLQGKPEAVDPLVASAALNAAQEIGMGTNPERSGAIAAGVLRNLTVAFSAAAAIATLSAVVVGAGSPALIGIATAAALVANEGLKKSAPFVILSELVTKGVNNVVQTEVASSLRNLGERFKPQLDLFRSVEKPLSMLASGREEFKWLNDAIGWIQGQAGNLGTKRARPSAPSLPLEVAPQTPSEIDNIYLAKITRVESTFQAAFVEFGGARHGFLPFDRIHPDYYQIPLKDRQELLDQTQFDARKMSVGRLGSELQDFQAADDTEIAAGRSRAERGQSTKNYLIQDVIKRRQIMLVQVTKDEVDNKGAALTTFLSVAGNYLVLTPNSAFGLRVSSRLSPEHRVRLSRLEIEVPEGMGVLVRSLAQNASNLEIREDFSNLVRTWETVRDNTLRSQAPKLVYDATNRRAAFQ